eukprot:1158896-Pelagomonas_calceolata.AAC.2
MGAFFAVGAPSALLLGWLGDRFNRVYLLFGVVRADSPSCAHALHKFMLGLSKKELLIYVHGPCVD